jgi:hypothetical protein
MKVALRSTKLYLDFPAKMLIIFLAISFTSSISNSPDRSYSLTQTANLASVSSLYIVLINLLDSKDRISRFLEYYVIAGILAIGFGILLYIFSLISGSQLYGVNLSEDLGNNAYGVYGTMREPNIYGSYSLVYFLLSTMMFYSRENDNSSMRKSNGFLFLISSIGVFLSFTRAVWLAAIIGFFMLSKYSKRYLSTPTRKAKIAGRVVLVAIIIIIMSNYVSDLFLTYKIGNIFNLEESTAAYRLVLWGAALENSQNHLLIGNGTYSFASFLSVGDSYNSQTNVWISNLFLGLLHDTGVLGLMVFVVFLISLYRSGISSSKKILYISRQNTTEILGFCTSLVCLMIAYIFTSGLSYGYTWIVFGMIGAYGRYVGEVETKIPERQS